MPARFYSDVNSAARRRFLLDTIGYQDVAYAEDQLFGQDVLKAGYYKAYAARGAVVHSNDLTYAEYSQRLFDEIVGLRMSGSPVPSPSSGFRAFVRAMVLDPLDIVRDRDYSAARKLFWLVVNPFYHLAKRTASRRASRVNLADSSALERGSLEAQRKAQRD
jgi:rhamnosyltransferase